MIKGMKPIIIKLSRRMRILWKVETRMGRSFPATLDSKVDALRYN